MKITVNNFPLEIHNGAKVMDAILKYFSQHGKKIPKQFPRVEDNYGNEVAPDSELTDGSILVIKTKNKKRSAFHATIAYLKRIQNIRSYRGERRVQVD